MLKPQLLHDVIAVAVDSRLLQQITIDGLWHKPIDGW